MYHSHSLTGYNSALGASALTGASSINGNIGAYNVALGAYALYYDSTGSYNTVVGAKALYFNTSGAINNAGGYLSLYNNTSGSVNVADGFGALYGNTTGSDNTAIGAEAMESNTTGTYNTAVGFGANVGSGTLTNATALGANASVSSSNQVIIGNSSVTSIGGFASWSNFSDGRYKKNIQQNVPGLAFINKLNPITYTLDVEGIETHLRRNAASLPDPGVSGKSAQDDPVMKQAMREKAAVTHTGFVAQDVEKAAESLNYVFSGVDKPKNADQSFYGLRYEDFVPPLVKAVQELSAGSDKKDSIINALQVRFDSLQTQLNELRATVLAQKSSALSGASLDQNAPNPFTGSTVIGYNLPAGVVSAKLQITDASGKVLAMIPLSGSGHQTVTANVAGYAAGTYQYSLIVDGKLVSTKQMFAVR
jgi:hypothetical protein